MTIVLLLALAAGPLYGQATEQPPPPMPAQEQPEVLTRGPVHEAFAEPVNLQVQSGGYVYGAVVSGARSPSDSPARVIPHGSGIAVPLGTAQILGQ
jgi:hypothetical protein